MISVAIAAGPEQVVVRPAQMESAELIEALQQAALFGPVKIFATELGVTPKLDGGALRLSQGRDAQEIMVSPDGSMRISLALPRSDFGGMIVIQEDVADLLNRALRYGAWVLEHIDPVQRVSRVVPAVRLNGMMHATWRTRAEQARDHNRSYSMSDVDPILVMPTPPVIPRQALGMNRDALVEDLVVLLRRTVR